MTVAIAQRPLVVEKDGERQSVAPGELVPDFDGWPARAKFAVVETGRVVEVTSPETIARAAREIPQFAKELTEALRAEGFRLTRAK